MGKTRTEHGGDDGQTDRTGRTVTMRQIRGRKKDRKTGKDGQTDTDRDWPGQGQTEKSRQDGQNGQDDDRRTAGTEWTGSRT